MMVNLSNRWLRWNKALVQRARAVCKAKVAIPGPRIYSSGYSYYSDLYTRIFKLSLYRILYTYVGYIYIYFLSKI